jgi:hypothetical protein
VITGRRCFAGCIRGLIRLEESDLVCPMKASCACQKYAHRYFPHGIFFAFASDCDCSRKSAEACLASSRNDDGLGASASMAATGKFKTCVWRWQELFMTAGIDGLLCGRTRPSRVMPVSADRVTEIVRLAQTPPPHQGYRI